MKTKTKSIGNKALGNRTVIGIVCIVAALVICFGVAPLVNRVTEGKVDIVRMANDLPKGSLITDNDIKIVSVGKYNLPDDVITNKEMVVGRYAAVDLIAEDTLIPKKLTGNVKTVNDVLEGLTEDEKAISITLHSFASGLSGKLKPGDTVSVLVYSRVDESTLAPEDLQSLKVITATTNKGVDVGEDTGGDQLATVTLLVTKEQAEQLVLYENSGIVHFVLNSRDKIGG